MRRSTSLFVNERCAGPSLLVRDEPKSLKTCFDRTSRAPERRSETTDGLASVEPARQPLLLLRSPCVAYVRRATTLTRFSSALLSERRDPFEQRS